MVRKRKVRSANEEKENDELPQSPATNSCSAVSQGPMYTIMSKVQLNETFHKRYIRELKQLYSKMDHDAFIYTFIKMIKSAMVAEETNEYAHTTLIFCAKFIGSFDGDETHPILVDTCRWLMTTISNNPHIRFRLCQFVNMILNALGQEATLDDTLCDSILEYMLGRLRDVSPSVRVQAILAMQRLQVPDNPDDPVLRSYQYHLCSDPSPRVRQAVITCMGRNYHTIPYVLDRLWDVDEKVRRHTYLHMSSYPVRSYKVSQRLTLLEQGLNDRSEIVRKVVTNVMLQQWIESYQKDIIGFIGALKLDSNEIELNRFRKIGKQALKEVFKRYSKTDLVACITLEGEGEFYRCVPHSELTLEVAFYWQCLTEYLQVEQAEELDLVVPELSTFCAYVDSFCRTRKREMDKFEAMVFQYVLLSLIEILYTFDLGDEIGRGNLQKLIGDLLRNYNLDEKVIAMIVKCAENVIPDQNVRHQFFLEIIQDICGLNSKQQDLVHDRNLISELLANSSDADLNLKLSALKVKILDLEEQEMNYVQKKDYAKAQQIIEDKNTAMEEFTLLLSPLLERHGTSGQSAQPLQFTKVVKNETILMSLQIIFHMIVSKNIKSLSHATCRLYNDFIFRHIASNQIVIRDWALKCGAAFSMLYEPLAKDVFEELYGQFFKNHNIRIWETAITCIFELLDRYGVDNFVMQEEQDKVKKSGRQLYNTLEFVDAEEDPQQSTTLGQGVDVIYMMSHFLDTCDDVCIVKAIVNGFCRLVLHGHLRNGEIIEKLLLRYFNPTTDPEINQILGVFLENLIEHKRQSLLQPYLMTTVTAVLCAPYDSPLHDIRPETITRFIIDATRQDTGVNGTDNTHNKLASIFLHEMVNNANNKDLCKLLARELLSLQLNVMQNEEFKIEMKGLADKLIQQKFDPKTIKNIIDFKDMLDGVIILSSKQTIDDNQSEEDEEKDTQLETTEQSQDTQTNANDNEGSCSNEVGQVSAPVRTPTTYGCENRTGHCYLRKSLNVSRNVSCSDSTVGEATRTTKIRIEARIDSDKTKEQQTNRSRVKRNLRPNQRCFENGSQELDRNCNSSQNSPKSGHRQPEIIEKIISSPDNGSVHSSEVVDTNRKSPTAALCDENDPKTTVAGNNERRKVTDFDAQHERRQSCTNTDGAETIPQPAALPSDEMDHSSEGEAAVIPASPPAERGGKRALPVRSFRFTRSRTKRNVADSIDKVPSANGSSTPLRNGRKRVLRTSPQLPLSKMSSPARKQPCIAIDIVPPLPNNKRELPRKAQALPRTTFSLRGKSRTANSKLTAVKSLTTAAGSRMNDSTSAHKRPTADTDSGSIRLDTKATESVFTKPRVLNKGKRKSGQSHTKVKVNLRSGDRNKRLSSSTVVTTRNLARNHLLSNTIMTRHRFFLENNTNNKVVAHANVLEEKSEREGNVVRASSRIPIKTKDNRGGGSTRGDSNDQRSPRRKTVANKLSLTRIPRVCLRQIVSRVPARQTIAARKTSRC